MGARWLGGVVAILLFFVFVIFGCDTITTPNAADCTSVADTTQPATVSYENDIAPLFAPNKYNCADMGCHASNLPGLTDYRMGSYSELFVAAAQARQEGMCEIKPGDPDQSYLIWKIEGHSGIQGARMPKDRSPMTSTDLQLLRQWILEGARNN
jgi:hypothetical protein